MCLKDIRPYAHKYANNYRFNNQHNLRDQYGQLMNTKSSFCSWIRCSYELQKLWGKWLWARFGFANHFAPIAFFMCLGSGHKMKNVWITRVYLRRKYAWTINCNGHSTSWPPTTMAHPIQAKPLVSCTLHTCHQPFNILHAQEFPNTSNPLYTSTCVESSHMQFLGVWYYELTRFHPKLKLLRTWLIFRLSNSLSKYIVAMLKVRYQEGNDNARYTNKECSSMTHKMRAQTLHIPKQPHGGSLRIWPRACCSWSTWDPSRWPQSAISIVIPFKHSISQAKSSSVKWICVNKHVLPTNEKASSFNFWPS